VVLDDPDRAPLLPTLPARGVNVVDLERLSPDDLLMLRADDRGQSMNIGAVITLEGQKLLDGDGKFDIERARKTVETRLHLVPRFRQILLIPRFGLGLPLWVDAQSFNIEDHVQIWHSHSRPLNGAQLLLACEGLRRRRLDDSRPPWEMWFLPSLTDGRVGLYVKLHHAIADGVAGVAALAGFLDLDSESLSPPPPRWEPSSLPTDGQLLLDNLKKRMQSTLRKLVVLTHPIASARRAHDAWTVMREWIGQTRVSRTSLNHPTGSRRTMRTLSQPLDLYKKIAQDHQAKVNDVLLSAITGGLRELLAGRGEALDELTLRAMVPMSQHQRDVRAAGNLNTAMMVSLPIHEADPVRRLELIAAETVELKKKARPRASMIFHSKLAQKAFLRHLTRQRMASLYVTNVPGPPVPLYFAGAKLLQVFPVMPIGGNVTLGIGALSYAGEFNITAVADPDSCPDLDLFIEGTRKALETMASSKRDKAA